MLDFSFVCDDMILSMQVFIIYLDWIRYTTLVCFKVPCSSPDVDQYNECYT